LKPTAPVTPERRRRGEVWWVDFHRRIGNEIREDHPALVISTDYLNDSPFGVLIVVPISSSSPSLRIHVDVPAGEGGMSKPSRIKCDQISKADIRRFRPKGRLGRLRPATLRGVEVILRRLLEL
jgi:mRNA-degrading endonuclease toxin of MazEF toxin-antitoxin module